MNRWTHRSRSTRTATSFSRRGACGDGAEDIRFIAVNHHIYPMEKTARLYNCIHCHRQVTICRSCDYGNRYCTGCAPVARVEGLRRAGKRYQSSIQGKLKHAARQQRYRQRQIEKMTHQGSKGISVCDLLSSQSEIRPLNITPVSKHKNGVISCDTCSLICSPFLRLQFVGTAVESIVSEVVMETSR